MRRQSPDSSDAVIGVDFRALVDRTMWLLLRGESKTRKSSRTWLREPPKWNLGYLATSVLLARYSLEVLLEYMILNYVTLIPCIKLISTMLNHLFNSALYCTSLHDVTLYYITIGLYAVHDLMWHWISIPFYYTIVYCTFLHDTTLDYTMPYYPYYAILYHTILS